MTPEQIHHIILNQLNGEISRSELLVLEKWQKFSDENEELYQQYINGWSIAQNGVVSEIPDKEKVWNKILSKILLQKPVKRYSRSLLIKVSGIAATIALIAGVSVSMLLRVEYILPTNEITIKAPRGQKSEVILPDGSLVWLNSGSAITYNSNYNVNNRDIKLEGEAFFDVKKSKSNKFIVYVDNIQVRVFGTAFDVKAYSDDQTIDISLLRGHVKVISAENNKILANLNPNQKAVVSRDNLHTHLLTCDAAIESLWKEGKLKINGNSTEEVIEKMSRWYGVDIKLLNNSNEKYWFTIKTESLTEMLNLINRITPINYSIKGEEVTIRYK